MLPRLTPAEAMERIDVVTAHAWMVRTFLKHADEFEDDPERMEVPRQIFDFCRALEGRRAKGDAAAYLTQARRKLHRLRRVAEWFSANVRDISAHTNFHQAAVSLSGCVRAIEEVLAAVDGDGSGAEGAGVAGQGPDDGDDEPGPIEE